MKKFVTLLLTAALAITAATTAFADNTETTVYPTTTSHPPLHVTYKVDPSYTVTIPTSVKLNATTPSTAKVKATNVTIPYGYRVEVALSSATGFKVKAGDYNGAPTLSYQVTVPNSTTPVQNDKPVLTVQSGAVNKEGQTTLTFKLTGDDIKYSGTYTDTVTFTVSIKAPQTTNP